jgi:hypothetical protein
MDKIINLDLMKNPFNWFTVYLMVMFGALAVKFLFPQQPAADQ